MWCCYSLCFGLWWQSLFFGSEVIFSVYIVFSENYCFPPNNITIINTSFIFLNYFNLFSVTNVFDINSGEIDRENIHHYSWRDVYLF